LLPMAMDCMTWQATFGNGVLIGMTLIVTCFRRYTTLDQASYGTQSRLYTVLVESCCGGMATSTPRNVSKNASIIEGTKSTSCHCIVSKNIQCKGHNFIKKYRKDLTKVRIILVMTETFLLAIFYTTPNYW